MKLIVVMLLIGLILAMAMPALPGQAQAGDPGPHPLVQMMSIAPIDAALASDEGWLTIGYVDLRANEQARPGVPQPASWAEYKGLDDAEEKLWNVNTGRLVGMLSEMAPLSAFDADMGDYLGLDYFEIDRVLSFGRWGQPGVVYGGHFDTDRIVETLTRRTYTVTELNGVPVLCGPVGCENGEEFHNWLPDQDERDPVTLRQKGVYPLFGGRMGRQEPIGLLPGILLSTANWEVMGRMTAAAAGTGTSLYDLPDYRAIADLAVAGGPGRSLLQVVFLSPSHFEPDLFALVLANRLEGVTFEELEAAFERVGIDESGKPIGAGDLPVYSLGAIVDWQEGPDRVHSLVLVYDNQADAQAAADEMTWRIPRHTAYVEWRKEVPLLELGGVEYTLDPPQALYHPVTGRWLAVATVRTPMPGNEPDPEDDNRIRSSGSVMAYWFQSWMVGYFVPVMLEPPAD